ncbi:Endophilin-B1 [Dirofilaria immitis]
MKNYQFIPMPKTLSEIKKLSAYSEDFEKAIGFIKITQEHTTAVVAAIEKLINAPPLKHSKPNDLERLAQVAQKYMPYFVCGSFYEALQATANVCLSVAKQEREVQMEAFQRVVTPMKSWIQEDYPRLMKDVKKCYILKDKMDRSMASVEARKTPERITKAKEARDKHQLFFERVRNEVMRYKAVHRHHMQCLKVLMLKSYQFERKAKNEFFEAFVKCEAEINADAAALKESPKYTTVEEMNSKQSEKESEDGSKKKKTSQRDSVKSDKPDQQEINLKKKKLEKELASIKMDKPKESDKPDEQKANIKKKKLEEQIASIKLDKPEKQTGNQKNNVEVNNKKSKDTVGKPEEIP